MPDFSWYIYFLEKELHGTASRQALHGLGTLNFIEEFIILWGYCKEFLYYKPLVKLIHSYFRPLCV